MKQQDQCVESRWAVRVGTHTQDSVPYFMGVEGNISSPALFTTKADAQKRCEEPYHKAVRVVIATLGEGI